MSIARKVVIFMFLFQAKPAFAETPCQPPRMLTCKNKQVERIDFCSTNKNGKTTYSGDIVYVCNESCAESKREFDRYQPIGKSDYAYMCQENRICGCQSMSKNRQIPLSFLSMILLTLFLRSRFPRGN